MINRVTENMKYLTITNNLFNVQGKSAELMEKLSTQKLINRPSDDPIGTNNVLNYRSVQASIEQYKANISEAKTWLSLTDTNLSGVKGVVNKALDIAVSQSSAVASEETWTANAAVLGSLIEDALSLMNAKMGDSYLFAGSRTDIAPFASIPSVATIGAASAATANNFDGTVTSGGVYTGTENKTYAVKIINGGTPPSLANASYQISSDGGKTWGATQTNLSAPITLGDGVTMTFVAGTVDLSTNDLFSVNAYAAGYYRGNDDELTMQIGKNNNFVYNITGSDAFTAVNGPVANASLVGAGAGLTADDTILLTRGAAVGSWTVTNHANYPDMVITSQSATAITIDADNDGTDDIAMALSGNWSANNIASFTVTGSTVGPPPTAPVLSSVAVHGPGSVDLLTTLNRLKDLLETGDLNNIDEVAAQIDDLKVMYSQVLQHQTQAGSKINSLDLTDSNHTALNEQITAMKSGIEDADLAKLITSFQMQQIAMEASYNLASKIGQMTILDFI